MNETRRVLDALRNWHDQQSGNGLSKPWVYAEEVRVATGFSAGYLLGDQSKVHPDLLSASEQRIDAYAAHTWPSKRGLRIAYEIKVSMTDLRRELKDPGKCAAAMALSNEFYLVIPDKMVALLPLLPGAWGVIRIGPRGGFKKTHPAEHRTTPSPPYSFMLSLARNIQNQKRRET